MAWDIPNIIINLRKEIEESSGDVSDLETRVGTLESTVSPLPGRITAAEAEIDALQADLDATPVTVTGTSIEIDNASAIPAESLTMEVVPTQVLYGYDKPWAAGAGKNILPLTLERLQSDNTSGTWSNNVYSYRNVTVTVNVDDRGNVTSLTVDGTASGNFSFDIKAIETIFTAGTTYIISGTPSGGSTETYYSFARYGDYDTGSGATFTPTATNIANGIYYSIQVASGYAATNLVFYPMIRLATETDPTFAPYANVCPITGKSSVKIETTDGETTNDAEVTLGTTVYAGEIDFNAGTGTSTMANIASYDGETINEPWLSSMDEYTEGGTPTTGAQVVYTLETPTALSFSSDKLTLLEGEQTVTGNGGGDITLSYQKDNLIGDLKKWILANT